MVLAHVVGDGVLQTRGIAGGKRKHICILLYHGALIAATTWVMVGHWTDAVSWRIGTIVGAAHIGVDLLKSCATRLCADSNGRLSARTDRVFDCVDQVCHFIVLAAVAWMVSRP